MSEEIAVIGLGRFGLFWAEYLSRSFRVLGTSRRTIPDLPAGVKQVELSEIAGVEAVFLCVAISSLEQVLPELSRLLAPGQLVIDTCSVKVYPVQQMLKHLPDSVEIIATHPVFGPDSARERVDRLPIITHPVRVKPERYAVWKKHFNELGFRVVEMSPEDHDHEAAYTQGVTHYLGRILANMDLQASSISTLGYTRLLQVMEQTCNDPQQLFKDLQRYNPYTREMREKLRIARERTEQLLEPLP